MFYIVLLIIAGVSMFILGIVNGIYESRHGKTLPEKKSAGFLLTSLVVLGGIIDGLFGGSKKK